MQLELGGIRVELGGKLGVLGSVNLEPEEHTGGGGNPLGNLLGHVGLHGVHGTVSLERVLLLQVDEPVKVTGLAPSRQHAVENGLGEATGELDGNLVESQESLNEGILGDDPAESGAGSQNLGVGVKSQNSAVGIKVEVRGDQRLEEGVVVLELLVVSGGLVLLELVHLQEVVGLVLDDENVVLLADLVDGLSSVGGHVTSGGVLAGGDGVEQLGLGSDPVVELLLKSLGEQTLQIDLGGDHLDLLAVGALNGGGEGELLAQNGVTGVGEGSQHRVPCVSVSGGGTNVPVLVGDVVDHGGVLLDEVDERLGTSRQTVLQGLGQRQIGLAGSRGVLGDMDLGELVLLESVDISHNGVLEGGLGGVDGHVVKGEERGQRKSSSEKGDRRVGLVHKGSLEVGLLSGLGLGGEQVREILGERLVVGGHFGMWW